MPIKRSKVNNPTGVPGSFSIPFGDEYLTVTYSRESYTPKLERELKEVTEQGLPGNMLALMMVSILRSWDMVDPHPDDVDLPDESKKKRWVAVPLNAGTLDELISVEALNTMVMKLGEANRPAEGESRTTLPSFEAEVG